MITKEQIAKLEYIVAADFVNLEPEEREAIRAALDMLNAQAELVAKHDTEQDYRHFLSYSGLKHHDIVRYAYFQGAGIGEDIPEVDNINSEDIGDIASKYCMAHHSANNEISFKVKGLIGFAIEMIEKYGIGFSHQARELSDDKDILDWLEKQAVSVHETMRYGHGKQLVSAIMDLEEETNGLRGKVRAVLAANGGA